LCQTLFHVEQCECECECDCRCEDSLRWQVFHVEQVCCLIPIWAQYRIGTG